MERCWLVMWISIICLFGGALPQYRDKNISRETDAVQEILAKYLQKRLQGAQVFSPPPPAVLFNVNRQSRARKNEDISNETDDQAEVDLNRTESQERRDDYDDYEDDLQGFEDSECSRTRINLFGKI